MDPCTAHSRPPTRRRPLEDATSRANIGTPLRQPDKKHHLLSSLPPALPHNESILPNGTLTVRNAVSSPEHKRVTALAHDERRDSKRDSQISQTSTNASTAGRKRKTHIGPWQLGKTIGKGGCSRVRAVRHRLTGQYGAAKIISKSVAEKARALSLANLVKSAEEGDTGFVNGKVIPFGLEREIVIMKLLDHPNIVRLYDVWENRNELYLIMEYVKGGELFSYIDEQGGLEEREIVYTIRQIIAALLYCHRIHIHHRDLKPENILLDRDTFQIKLVDFGMAALQPFGKFLSTPCGSPHYAAPEILSCKPYDGGQADVWSCGVILYVMFTGLTPFNYPNDDRMSEEKRTRLLYHAICTARYEMPEDLSAEGKDLLRRMFVANPNKRITMKEIWNHPFLHKFDAEFGYEAEHNEEEYWVGPGPRIEDWKPLKRHDVDREILRNMRTLWHSEKEATLIERLLNDKPNQEKLFYSALLKHREDHLENYTGSPGGIGYSASDYQHLQPVTQNEDLPPVPSTTHNRSHSQYSILNNEHLNSRHSFYQPPPSESSYDPFRASRDPIIQAKNSYMNVTVHRGSLSGSRNCRDGTSISQRPRESLRIEALKRKNRRSSGISHTSVSTKGSPGRRSSGPHRNSSTRSSTRSSLWTSSPPIARRPSSAHKRAVNFSHLRKNSTASGMAARPNSADPHYTPDQRRLLRGSRQDDAFDRTLLTSSPSPQSGQVIRSQKENIGFERPRLPARRAQNPNQQIEKEARKVSTELGKFCEEAFFRSSISSSIRTSTTEKPDVYDTPPSSISNRDSSRYVSNKPTALDTQAMQTRPLPPLPVETPKTFTARQLAETRARLAARYAEEGGDSALYFQEVLAHLDNLLPASLTSVPGDGRRSVSAPPAKSPDGFGTLPVISEEGRFTDADEDHIADELVLRGHRAVTDPIGQRAPGRGRKFAEQNTIRMVDPSSPTPIAPLNIRKVSGASSTSQSTKTPNKQPLTALQAVKAPGTSARGLRRRISDFEIAVDEPADNDTKVSSLTSSGDKTVVRKKGSWFWRGKLSGKEEKENARPRGQHAWEDLDDRVKAQKTVTKHRKKPSDPLSDTSEFPMRQRTEPAANKKGFMRLFGKKSATKQDAGKLELGSPTNISSPSLMSGFDLPEHDDASARPIEAQHTNWLARFLHIKPASKILCFQVGRGRARQELVRLLRDKGKPFGVRDVQFDRKTNVVTARVDRSNQLRIKPVAFAAELFVVLEHGRRANLCLARFTQTRGAASAFRKVLELLEERLGNMGLLVEDAERRRAMCEIFG